jgi:hypothetical protein
MMKRRDHTPITGKKIKSNSTGDKLQEARREVDNTNDRVSLIDKKSLNLPSSNDSISSS